jgi:hypothetical protein
MAPITPKQARDYLDRWKIVREAETAELRRSSLETRLDQISTLVGSRHLFAADPDRERRVDEVRARWLTIRKAFDV